ncbi:MAG: glycosyl hydrolase [Candidatus Saccharimonadia bacterium]
MTVLFGIVGILAAIGIYQVFFAHATPQIPGDLNGDGVVNILDLSILASNWGVHTGAGSSSGDINSDGIVDITDLSIMASNWNQTSLSGVITADPNATPEAVNLLKLLNTLPSNPSHRILSGQFVDDSSLYASNVNPITTATGKTPSIIGYDFFWDYSGSASCNSGAPRSNNWQDIADDAVAKAQVGHIIEISFHLDNPENACAYSNRTIDSSIFTSGTIGNTNLNASLNNEVSAFTQLQNNHIPVLFRPYHEMNGNWFWWGSQSWYPQLWQYTFNYLTSHGVHNLIYVYSPNLSADMTHYPGNNYVDVVGVDTYSATPNDGQWITAQQSYAQSTPGKPFAISEFGFANPPAANTYDNSVLLGGLTATANQATGPSYFMSWSDQWNIDQQKNLSVLYQNSAIANLGDYTNP